MSMPHADNENPAILFDPVDDEMSLERVDAHGRRQLKPFPRHSGIVRDQVEDGKQFVVISLSLPVSKQAHAILGNADNVFFRFEG